MEHVHREFAVEKKFHSSAAAPPVLRCPQIISLTGANSYWLPSQEVCVQDMGKCECIKSQLNAMVSVKYSESISIHQTLLNVDGFMGPINHFCFGWKNSVTKYKRFFFCCVAPALLPTASQIIDHWVHINQEAPPSSLCLCFPTVYPLHPAWQKPDFKYWKKWAESTVGFHPQHDRS